jgi:hypothetical protein
MRENDTPDLFLGQAPRPDISQVAQFRIVACKSSLFVSSSRGGERGFGENQPRPAKAIIGACSS